MHISISDVHTVLFAPLSWTFIFICVRLWWKTKHIYLITVLTNTNYLLILMHLYFTWVFQFYYYYVILLFNYIPTRFNSYTTYFAY